MAAKASDLVISHFVTDQDEEIRHAIDNFMRALQTYADRAACEPGLTFEQHFCHVAAEELQSLPALRVH